MLGDLVGIHAGCWNFDCSLPVEVVVAEIVGELLNDCFGNFRVVEGHIEVSRKDTALVSCLGDEVEVVLCFLVITLNDA